MKDQSFYSEKVNQAVASALIGDRKILQANYRKHGGRKAYLAAKFAEHDAMPLSRFIDRKIGSQEIDGKRVAKITYILCAKKRAQDIGGKVGEFETMELANDKASELGLK